MTPPIRAARPVDAPALSRLKLATFREAFLEDHAIPYPAADLVLFETETYGLDRVTADLADPTHRTWVVDGKATDGDAGELVAYAHVGPCKLPNPDVEPGDWEFHQLYVRRTAQGRGLGSALLARALAWLNDQGGPIWLGVWSGNTGAQALYARWGFVAVGQHSFRVGSWLDEEITMRLDPIALSGGS